MNINKYPKAEMFKVITAVTMPHEYMLSNKVRAFISTQCDGILSDKSVKKYEDMHGPSCEVPDCNMTVDEHVLALVIEVDHDDLDKAPGLFDFMLKCKPFMEEDGFVGFSFIRKEVNETPG